MKKLIRVITVLYKKIIIRIMRFLKKHDLIFLHYLFNKDYLFEKSEVFYGIKKYKLSNANIYLLRRNIHRIEKGLSMRNQKSVFAEKYIEETLVQYNACVNKNLDFSTLEWAYSVLVKYFELMNKNNQENKNLKVSDIIKPVHKNNSNADFESTLNKQLSENHKYEYLYNILTQRKSVRLYEKKKIPRELIYLAIKNASLAPSACNRQSLYYRIIDEPKLVEKISDIIPGMTSFKNEAPLIVILIGDYAAYELESDRHLIYIDGGLSAMLFMMGLEVVGLKSCALNWPYTKCNEDKIRKVINMEKSEQCIVLFTVGFSDINKVEPESIRKNLTEYIKYNND